MTEKFPLAGTDITVRVDWDLMHVSFGADTSELHCWHCAQPFTADGAYKSLKDLPDGRLTWFDADRYAFASPEATSCLICKPCRDTVDPQAKPYGRRPATTQAPAAKADSRPTSAQIFDQIMANDEQRCRLEVDLSTLIDQHLRSDADAVRVQLAHLAEQRETLAAQWNALNA